MIGSRTPRFLFVSGIFPALSFLLGFAFLLFQSELFISGFLFLFAVLFSSFLTITAKRTRRIDKIAHRDISIINYVSSLVSSLVYSFISFLFTNGYLCFFASFRTLVFINTFLVHIQVPRY